MYKYLTIALSLLVFLGGLMMYINYCVKYEVNSMKKNLSEKQIKHESTEVQRNSELASYRQSESPSQTHQREHENFDDMESYIDPAK